MQPDNQQLENKSSIIESDKFDKILSKPVGNIKALENSLLEEASIKDNNPSKVNIDNLSLLAKNKEKSLGDLMTQVNNKLNLPPKSTKNKKIFKNLAKKPNSLINLDEKPSANFLAELINDDDISMNDIKHINLDKLNEALKGLI